MLSKESLEKVTGRFTAKGLSIDFVVKENRLHALLHNIDLLLRAENETSFYADNFNTLFQFQKNSSGIFDTLIIHEHGKDLELKRK
jgi:hypothetical protein